MDLKGKTPNFAHTLIIVEGRRNDKTNFRNHNRAEIMEG